MIPRLPNHLWIQVSRIKSNKREPEGEKNPPPNMFLNQVGIMCYFLYRQSEHLVQMRLQMSIVLTFKTRTSVALLSDMFQSKLAYFTG